MVGKDDGPDVVQGIVLMRYSGETPSTLEGVHKRVNYIRRRTRSPAGHGDRALLRPRRLSWASRCTRCIENLTSGWSSSRSCSCSSSATGAPRSSRRSTFRWRCSCAFCGLVGPGTSANLISLGAVDFGIVVDSTVIMMENIFRHLGAHGKGTMRGAHPRAARARWARR